MLVLELFLSACTGFELNEFFKGKLVVFAHRLDYINHSILAPTKLCSEFSLINMSIDLKKKIFAKEIKAVEKSKEVFPVADDFLRLARFFFHSIGVEPYESDQETSLGFRLYLVFHVINMFFIYILMMVFVTSSVGPNADFLHISMVVGYITFGNVGVLKIIVVQLQKRKLSSLVRHMKSLFPPPVAKVQEQYAVGHYMKFCSLELARKLEILAGLFASVHSSLHLHLRLYIRRSHDVRRGHPGHHAFR